MNENLYFPVLRLSQKTPIDMNTFISTQDSFSDKFSLRLVEDMIEEALKISPSFKKKIKNHLKTDFWELICDIKFAYQARYETRTGNAKFQSFVISEVFTNSKTFKLITDGDKDSYTEADLELFDRRIRKFKKIRQNEELSTTRKSK